MIELGCKLNTIKYKKKGMSLYILTELYIRLLNSNTLKECNVYILIADS